VKATLGNAAAVVEVGSALGNGALTAGGATRSVAAKV
jgi:hypothetical protein